jgi:hypothetical protein
MTPPKKKKKYPPDPEWVNDPPLDADRPLLQQLEERVYLLPDDEFQEALEWLEENFYRRPEIMSLFEARRPIVRPRRPDETLH